MVQERSLQVGCSTLMLFLRKLTRIIAVNWINSDYFRSLEHIQMVYDIRESMRRHGNISVMYCSRSSNSYADDLAKKGSNMVGDVVHWSSI
ncbi:hypothetical protein Q3G72_013821 [Acer saccharum]|nr:hypothetical protein Q3G72_013821 [Acer saccharum]